MSDAAAHPHAGADGPNTPEPRAHVLLVDDDPDLRWILSRGLEAAGYVVSTAALGREGLTALVGDPLPDVVLLDLRLPDIDAFTFLAERPESAAEVPIVVVTGEGDESVAVRLMKLGVRDYLVKGPELRKALPTAIRHALSETRLEQRARESELRYRALFANSGDAIFISGTDGIVIDANEAACRLLGLSLETVVGRSLELIEAPPPGASQGWLRRRFEILRERGRLAFDTQLLRADGHHVPVEVVSTLHPISGQPIAFSVARDVTERHRQNAMVARAEAEWEETFDTIGDPLFVTDSEGRITRANRALYSRIGLGASGVLGQPCDEILCDEGAHAGRPTEWPPRRPCSWEAAIARLQGYFGITVYPSFDSAGTVQRLVFHLKDTTAERELRARILQTEKLSSLGQLVSGVAHELNNPLAAIQGLSEILLEDVGLEGVDPADIRSILDQAKRAGAIVRNLLQFARQGGKRLEPFGLNEAVEAAVSLVRYRLSAQGIELELDLDDSLPLLVGVMQQIEQVVVNLLVNSYQAISERGREGRIRIRTSPSDEGKSVTLVVEDDGPGVRAEIADRIFEPFFTTKDVGRGSGLGLSVSYGLVQDHGGDIQLDQHHTGGGARFVVRLPLSSGIAALPVPISPPEPDEHGRVLLVDDEPALLESMRRALSARGFVVKALGSAREALEQLEQADFDLVISDLGLPGMDGLALHKELVTRFPEYGQRFLLLTGGSVDDVRGDDGKELPTLLKPFSNDRLCEWAAHNLRKLRLGEHHGVT